ncbi:hypothetical protein [Pontibacter diazotrophicus]|uniref:hypothetical protein n=1 Tax=Pontibacter diazotrophicus TaxID=1400979 RepID=UPI0015F1B669|nr:hypothetical protein [Pontibacter diazotrophicus]
MRYRHLLRKCRDQSPHQAARIKQGDCYFLMTIAPALPQTLRMPGRDRLGYKSRTPHPL